MDYFKTNSKRISITVKLLLLSLVKIKRGPYTSIGLFEKRVGGIRRSVQIYICVLVQTKLNKQNIYVFVYIDLC